MERHNFCLCVHCGAVVDLKDSFGDKCPECSKPAEWEDNPVELARVVDLMRQDHDQEA